MAQKSESVFKFVALDFRRVVMIMELLRVQIFYQKANKIDVKGTASLETTDFINFETPISLKKPSKSIL